jgi:hypothetical protein
MRSWQAKRKQDQILGMNMQILWNGLCPHPRQNILLKYYQSRKIGISLLPTSVFQVNGVSCKLEASSRPLSLILFLELDVILAV